jgi:hypothetical protein
MITITDAINSLVSTKTAHYIDKGVITGWDVAEVKTGVTQPTQAEIDAEVIRLQADYDAKAYARSREAEYPSIADQLDDIYHNGIDAWKATIKTTKDKYPKE